MPDHPPRGFFGPDDEATDDPRTAGLVVPGAPRRRARGFFGPDRGDTVAVALDRARDTPPDAAARIFRLQLETGLPADFLSRRLDEVERAVAAEGFDAATFRRESPALAGWLAEGPERAAVVQDDLIPLTRLERTLRTGRRTVGALSTGPLAISGGVWGLLRAGAEWAGADELAGFAAGTAQIADHLRTRVRGRGADVGGVAGAVYSGLESLSLTGSALALVGATGGGGTPALLGILGGVTAGEAYGQARDEGRSLGVATLFAGGQGAIEAATELLPMRYLLGDVATGAGLARVLGHQLLSELPGEQAATILQDLNEFAVLEPEATFADYLAERPSRAAETLIATLVAVGGQTAVVGAWQRATGTPASQAVVEDLHAAAEASTTRTRAPEAFTAVVEQAAADGLTHVYAPAESLTAYYQARGQDPAEAARDLTGDPGAYALAMATGGDLAIPTGRYLARVVGSGHETFFAQELRLAPDQLNARETQAQLRGEAEAATLLPETLTQEAAAAETRATITAAVTERLVATGRHTQAEAETLASLMARLFEQLPAREGQDPLGRFRDWIARSGGGVVAAERPDAGTIASFAQRQAEGAAADPQLAALLAEFADVPEGTLVDDPGPEAIAVNASAESAASLEAQRRLAGMQARGESFVVRDRAGRLRPLLGAEAVDYRPQPGEAFGILSPDGFRVLEQGAQRRVTEFYQARAGDQQSGPAASTDDAAEGPDTTRPAIARPAGPQSSLAQDQDAEILGTFDPVSRLIKLLPGANRSTFLHETAHLFLEFRSELAAQESATAREREDLAALLRWFGFEGDLPAWRALTDEQRRVHHEQFAEGFEDYLREGKAPTPEVQPLFTRFAAWLTALARTLRRRRAPLTDEVRRVLDRLIASETAIAAAEADALVAPLFVDAAAAGVSETEFAAYRRQLEAASADARAQLQQRLMRELAREQARAWQAEREPLRTTVATEIQQHPVYRALATLRGRQPDGTPLPADTPRPSLNRDLLVAQFGEGILGQLPRSVPALSSPQGELSADAAAEIVGFPSGQALIDALVAKPVPIEEAIDRETDRRMEQRHGTLLQDPAALATEARAAVAGEHRDTIVRAELRMLQRLRAGAAPGVRVARAEASDAARAAQRERDYERRWLEAEARLRVAIAEGRKQAEIDALQTEVRQLKAQARGGAARIRADLPDAATLARLATTQIAGMRLRDIRPERFFAAARRAGRRATETAARQELDAAIRAKQDELVNLALYREATTARQAVDEARTRFDGMFRADDALRKTRNLDYVTAARALAAAYFWPERRLDRATVALKRVKEYTAADVYDFLEERIESVLALGTDLRALTYDEFRVMAETVDGLWEQARRDQQMLVDGERVERAEVVAAFQERFDQVGTPASQFYRTDTERTLDLLNAKGALTRVEHWVTYMDGGDPHGVFRRYLWQPVSEAADAYRARREEYQRKWLALVQSIESTLRPGAIAAPELGFTFETKAHLLGAIAHTGNTSNKQKLLLGYKWGVLNEDGSLDDRRWRAFLERAWRESLVTQADMRFVEGLWALHEELKPEAQRAFREIYGVYFTEITAEPFETPWGTSPGGYVPAMRDPLRVASQAIHSEQQLLTDGQQNGFMFPVARPGFAKARNENYWQPLELNIAAAPRHLDAVLRLIHLGPRVHDVGRLLWTHELRNRLHAHDPKVVQTVLVPWLQRSYAQRVSLPGRFPVADKFWRGMRTHTGLNIMAGHVVNALQQVTGLSAALVQVKARHMRNALWRYRADHRRYVDFVVESDPMMRTRTHAQVVEIRKTTEDLLLNPTKYEQAREWTKAHGYALQAAAQNVVDLVTWGGAYEQASEAGHDHATAVRAAASAVRETQGSFAPEDLASFEVNTPFVRAFTMFSTFFNTMANLNVSQAAMTVRDVGYVRGAPRLFQIYLFGFASIAVVGDAIMQGFGGWERDDDEYWLDDLMWGFFSSQARFVTGALPGVGPAINYGFDKALRAIVPERAPRYEDRISTSPVISMLEGAGRAPHSVTKAIVGEGAWRTAVRDGLDFFALLTRFPLGALKRPAGYLADVAEGREDPEDALEVTRGLVSGRAPEE